MSVSMIMLMLVFRTVRMIMVVCMVMVMAMMMVVSVIVIMSMSMAMRMSVVRMTTHCYHTEQIDEQSHSTDQKKLIGVHLWWVQPRRGTLGQTAPLRKPVSAYRRCIASNTINIEIRIRKMPFAKPESVSIRPYLERMPSHQINFGDK